MTDLIDCPGCGGAVSRRALTCLSCGGMLNEVPNEVTPELVRSLHGNELPDLLHSYVAEVFSESGCFNRDGPPDSGVLASLPRVLRVAYTLSILESEVTNGGFYQWLTNSSGRLTQETLGDLLIIGATAQADVVSEVVRLNQELESRYDSYRRRWESPQPRGEPSEVDAFWTDMDENYAPQFDRLSVEYYSLQDSDSAWPRFDRFAREHIDECAHNRSPPVND